MTQILMGDHEETIAEAHRISHKLIRSVLPYEEDSEEEQTENSPTYYEWLSRSLAPEVVTFISPKTTELNPKYIKPRSDRHLMFEDKLPAAWLKWALEHRGKVTVREFVADPKTMLKKLLDTKLFDLSGARYAIAINPKSTQAINNFIQQCVALELSIPITEETLIDVWPYVPATGKAFKTSITRVLRSLGDPTSIHLVNDISDSECFMLLSGLRKAMTKRPECLTLIELSFNAIETRKLKPKAALYVFLHAMIPSKEKHSCRYPLMVNTSTSLQMKRMYPLFGLDSWDP